MMAASDSGLRRFIVRAALAFSVLGFAPGLLDPFNAPKAAALRVLGLALLAATLAEKLAGLIAGGASGRVPRSAGSGLARVRASVPDGAGSVRAAAAIDIAVAAWVAASLLSTVTGRAPRLSLLGEIGQREGLLTTLALAGLYAGARRSHADPAHARRTLDVVIACAALAAAYGLLQLARLDPLAWANPSVYPVEGDAVTRPFATLGNSILLGNLLAAGLAAGVARFASGRGDPRRLAAAVALIAAATAATLSRGAWLAAAAGATLAVAGAFASGGARTARRAWLALAAAVAPAALLAATVLRAAVLARLAEATSPEAVSGPARVEIARAALALWRAHPWLGGGPDSFGLLFPGVMTPAFWRSEWLGMPLHAHSAALQAVATLGAAGALAGLVWLAALAWALARGPADHERLALGASLAALAVAGALNPVGLAGAAGFAVLSALVACGAGFAPDGAAPPARPAVVAGARHADRDRRRSRGRHSRLLPTGVAVGTAIAVAFAGAREMSALAAAGRARAALDQATGVRPAERGPLAGIAARNAEAAASLAPGEDEVWRLACDASLARAEVGLARHDPAAAGASAATARDAAARALSLTPGRASNHDRLGNALMMRARVVAATESRAMVAPGSAWAAIADSADAAFAGARRLAPADALFLADQARGQLLLGRAEGARATARRVVALYPDAATGHALEAAALVSIGSLEAARGALLRARAGRWEDESESQRRAVEDLLRALDGADSAR